MHAAIPQVFSAPVGTGLVAPAQEQLRTRAGPRSADAVVAHPTWCDGLPQLDADRLFASATRLVLVAPRPGDGVQAAGGLLAAAARRALPVWVWVLTDGEGHASAARWRPRLDSALDALDVRSGGIERFRLPVGSLHAERDVLGDRLRRQLQPGDVVLAPQPSDGTGDEAAVAHAVAAAATCSGCVRLGVPLHDGWHAPSLLASRQLRRFELDPDLVARKRAAWHAFGGAPAAAALAAPVPPRTDIEIVALG